jgi:diguanylate cyclase (GGDEF)-like protein
MLDPAIASALLEVLPTGVLLFGTDGKVLHATEAAAQLLGMPLSGLPGKSLRELAGGKDVAANAARVSLPTADGNQGGRIECLLRDLPATLAPYVRLGCLVDPSQVETRRGLRIPPLAEMDVARLDPETGLLNRKNILQELNAQVSRSRRYGNALSVLYVQLPALAPDALRALAQSLKGTLRWVDIVGRWDDDSLLVILPETSRDAARVLATKLSQVMASGHETIAAANVGSAQWARGEESVDVVTRAAAELESARSHAANEAGERPHITH